MTKRKAIPWIFLQFLESSFSFPVFRLVSPKTPGIEWQKGGGNKKENWVSVSVSLFIHSAAGNCSALASHFSVGGADFTRALFTHNEFVLSAEDPVCAAGARSPAYATRERKKIQNFGPSPRLRPLRPVWNVIKHSISLRWTFREQSLFGKIRKKAFRNHTYKCFRAKQLSKTTHAPEYHKVRPCIV